MSTHPGIGLRNAPVTKLLLGSIVLNSTIASVLDIREFFHLGLTPQALSYHEIWRLGTWQLLYNSFGEVIFGSLALYKLASTERFLGSKRYAAFVCIALTTTSLLVPAVIGMLVRPFSARANTLACGLTPTIFAILFQWHALIPSASLLVLTKPDEEDTNETDHSDTWQDMITDKVWVYALAAQLASSRYPTSLVGAATGWLVGALYHTGYLPRQWLLPRFMTTWLTPPPQSTIIRERQDDFPGQRSRVNQHNMRNTDDGVTATLARASGQAPSGADIQNLMSMMNVSREVAQDAFTTSNGSLEAAIDNLLARNEH